MIITNKKIDKNSSFRNYVKISDGWVIYTNAFIFLKREIKTECKQEKPIFININDWKIINKKKGLSFKEIKGATAIFSDLKDNYYHLPYKEDVDYSRVDNFLKEIKEEKPISEIKLSLFVLEDIIKQMKLENRNIFTFEILKNEKIKIKDSSHSFMACS